MRPPLQCRGPLHDQTNPDGQQKLRRREYRHARGNGARHNKTDRGDVGREGLVLGAGAAR
jgi:hypothetical protein